ncbi:MAG TPA: hypothetical protein VKL40_11670 [Candidatus Angelobacter sp.]|nr:hypothetical protein [Candidatus Angelobacter sp.]
MPPDPLSGFNSKTFAAQLHTQFKVVQGGEPPVILELTEVNEPQTSPEVELFILVFQGPRTPRLEQKTHHFDHHVLGAFDMFVTAIAGDDQGISYEAVFHRLHTKKS